MDFGKSIFLGLKEMKKESWSSSVCGWVV